MVKFITGHRGRHRPGRSAGTNGIFEFTGENAETKNALSTGGSRRSSTWSSAGIAASACSAPRKRLSARTAGRCD